MWRFLKEKKWLVWLVSNWLSVMISIWGYLLLQKDVGRIYLLLLRLEESQRGGISSGFSGVQAIPSYATAYFKLPKKLIRDLHRLIANFWWGSKEGKSKMHWCKWSGMCLGKEKEGMGFRDLESFNQALLAKQGWRLLRNPGSLV